MKRYLITGGAGYLGSWVCRTLLERGHGVRCFDALLFGDAGVRGLRNEPHFELVRGDILDPPEGLFEGVAGVVHLAGLANDPSADLDEDLTRLANRDATLKLAREALSHGVRRFVFASSCSVYGTGHGTSLDEDSELRPVSLYARSKIEAEQGLMDLVAEGLEPCSLRQATLYGDSPRMRFDLAVNLMTLHAVEKQRVFVLGGGQQWRPFLHVRDSAELFCRVLEAPAERVAGRVFNVGHPRENLRIEDLAQRVRERVPGVEVEHAPGDADRRTYNVCFDRVRDELEWQPRHGIDGAIDEIRSRLESGELGDTGRHVFYNIRTHQHLQTQPVTHGGQPLRSSFLPFALPDIGEDEEREVIEVLRSGWVTTGPRTARFESDLREYTGAAEIVAVNSCTAALHLSLALLDLAPGDEVITSPITWPATANVIEHVGARPVFVDVEEGTSNLDVRAVEAAITDRTRVLLPVHMAGYPCDLDGIHRLAEAHGLEVIEDAAHALGARYKDRKVGSLSRFTCFSFYPIKNMTTGEGGALALADAADAERARILALHGITRDAWDRYTRSGSRHWECVEPGFKYNMPDLCAALGIHQLRKLDGFIERRRHLARIYDRELRDLPGLELPTRTDDPGHAHHLYVVRIQQERFGLDRDALAEALRRENIGTGIHFRGLHLQPWYRERYDLQPQDYPIASALSETILSLPLYPKMQDGDVLSVIRTLEKLSAYHGP